MTTYIIRLPQKLARKLKARARAAKTTPSELLRQAAEQFVASPQNGKKLTAMQRHILSRAGTWDGDISAQQLLHMTRL